MKTVCLALLLFCCSPPLALAEPPELPQVQTYDQSVRAIRDSWRSTHPENKRERVLEVWTIGKLIELHGSEYSKDDRHQEKGQRHKPAGLSG